MPSIVVLADPIRSLAFASIGITYLPIGTPFQHPVRILKIVNTTSSDMLVSFDGTSDNDIVPMGGFTLYDLTTNHNETAGWFFKIGTQVYIKYLVAPTSGAVYVVALYGEGE